MHLYRNGKLRAGCILSPSISLNCAFARVAFRELSKETYDQRTIQFKELFCDYPGFCLPDSYFTDCGKKKPSQFERDFAKINKAFWSKWHPPAARLQYERQFSTAKWKSLSNRNTLSVSVKLAMFSSYSTKSFFHSSHCLSPNQCFILTCMTSRG